LREGGLEIMPIEKSAGAVMFRRENNKIKYLLIEYPGFRGKPHWGFPRGIIEKGESLEQTAQRETKEETGIDKLQFVDGFKEWIKFYFKHKGKTIMKIATFLLAETETEKINLSKEHDNYKWLEYKQALELATFDNTKKILKKAHQFIKSQS